MHREARFSHESTDSAESEERGADSSSFFKVLLALGLFTCVYHTRSADGTGWTLMLCFQICAGECPHLLVLHH